MFFTYLGEDYFGLLFFIPSPLRSSFIYFIKPEKVANENW